MSVSLNCPNCGAIVGEASHENNYQEIFYFRDDKGDVICKNCGTGSIDNNFIRNIGIIFCVIFLFLWIAVLSF